jgi:hypothetical protein
MALADGFRSSLDKLEAAFTCNRCRRLEHGRLRLEAKEDSANHLYHSWVDGEVLGHGVHISKAAFQRKTRVEGRGSTSQIDKIYDLHGAGEDMARR